MASTWPIVRQTLVNILEASEPDDHTGYVTGRFQYLENGVEERAVPDRGFQVLLESGNAELPGCYAMRGRLSCMVNIVVAYNKAHDAGRLDEILGSDVENIIGQLLDQGNWDQANSNIELIGARDGNISSMPFEIVPFDDNIILLAF